jgi:hypothetical protein
LVKESKRTRLHRECGLAFAWMLPEASGWAAFMAILIAGALAAFLFTSLRVRVVPPPRVIERKAEVILIPSGAAGREWEIRAQEAGPFPTRFEPTAWPGFRQLEEAALASLQTNGTRRPELHEWPAEPAVIATPVAMKGQRVLPKVDWKPVLPPIRTGDARKGWDLELQRLTVLPDDAWPMVLPEFTGELDPTAAAASWRFLVQVDPDGRVEQCLMLNASSEAGGTVLEQWLRGVRFGPSAAKAGWIGVGILFKRKS